MALDALSNDYPGIGKLVDGVREIYANSDDSWPEECFVPNSIMNTLTDLLSRTTGLPNGAVNASWEAARISAIMAWRTTQGIYRIDKEVHTALVETPLSDEIPVEVLKRLPEWCIYIETPDFVVEKMEIYGVWVHLDTFGGKDLDDLRIWVDCELPFPLVLELKAGNIAGNLNRRLIFKPTALTRELGVCREGCVDFVLEMLKVIVPLVLYICTQADEIGDGKKAPTKPIAKRIKGGSVRFFPPDKITSWDVGVRMGAAIRRAKQSDAHRFGPDSLRNAPRAHIRRAHWHTSRIGPRKLADGTVINAQARDFVVRWQPPIAVNVVDVADLPATIRPVH
jgi:hypothetical protein